MNTLAMHLKNLPSRQTILFLIVTAATWLGPLSVADPAFGNFVGVLPNERQNHPGNALQLFFYDTPKVLLLLIGAVFIMGIVHPYAPPERLRALPSGRRLGARNAMSASLSIVMPFCLRSIVNRSKGPHERGQTLAGSSHV